MKNYTRTLMNPGRACKREWFKFTEKNRKGETILIEICDCDMHDRWRKEHGFKFDKWLSVRTYVTDESGCCRGVYNPSYRIKVTEYKNGTPIFTQIFENQEEYAKWRNQNPFKQTPVHYLGIANIVNPNYIMEDTEENRLKIIEDVYNLAFEKALSQ